MKTACSFCGVEELNYERKQQKTAETLQSKTFGTLRYFTAVQQPSSVPLPAVKDRFPRNGAFPYKAAISVHPCRSLYVVSFNIRMLPGVFKNPIRLQRPLLLGTVGNAGPPKEPEVCNMYFN